MQRQRHRCAGKSAAVGVESEGSGKPHCEDNTMSEREQPPRPEDRGWGRAPLNLALYTRVPREMEEGAAYVLVKVGTPGSNRS